MKQKESRGCKKHSDLVRMTPPWAGSWAFSWYLLQCEPDKACKDALADLSVQTCA